MARFLTAYVTAIPGKGLQHGQAGVLSDQGSSSCLWNPASWLSPARSDILTNDLPQKLNEVMQSENTYENTHDIFLSDLRCQGTTWSI